MLGIEEEIYTLPPSKLTAPSTVSMSTYFPRGTQYFYGYPAGENSSFLNNVPPMIEELVAARTVSCAGPHVSAVSFASTSAPVIDSELLKELSIPQVDSMLMTLLPEDIDTRLHGNERNEAIMAALAKIVAPGSLVMAQPFTDEVVSELYQIPPEITVWLNDKDNMSQYIRSELMPKKFGSYCSGADFIAHKTDVTLPCVVKVSSSSSGDGVYICRSERAFSKACKRLQDFDGKIIAEQYIETKKNYGLHFGIPHDRTKPIDIIGVNEQITTDDGEFIGGFIDTTDLHQTLAPLKRYLLNDVLPAVRALGWYGVGGFDVIIDEQGKAHFIDCNFRMTGMSAYHFLVAKQTITTPLVSFAGQFTGSRDAFVRAMLPYAGRHSKDKMVQLIALSQHDNNWNFNGALMYANKRQLKQRISMLLETGINSPALHQLSARHEASF